MDKNTKKFKSPLHEYLWSEYVNVVPIEMSTVGLKYGRLFESCLDFYDFVLDTYNDMLSKPDKYGFNPDDTMSVDIGWGNRKYARINFYKYIISDLIDIAMIKADNHLLINAQEFDKWLEALKNKKYKKEKLFLDLSVFNQLWDSLPRTGLEIERHGTEVLVVNKKYNYMFLAAKLLIKEAKAQYGKIDANGSPYHNLDFRVIENPRRKPEIEDFLYPLTPKEKAVFNEIIAIFASNKKMRHKITGGGRSRTYDIWLKKRNIVHIYWSGGIFALSVELPDPETESHDALLKKINELDDSKQIIDYFTENIKVCKFCSEACVKNNAFKAYNKNRLFLGRSFDKLIASCGGLRYSWQLNEDFTGKISETVSTDIKTLIKILSQCEA